MVILITWEPAGKLERLVPMGLARASMERGGYDKVQICDPETRVVIMSRTELEQI